MDKTTNFGLNIIEKIRTRFPNLDIGAMWDHLVTANFQKIDAELKKLSAPTDDRLTEIIENFISENPELFNITVATETSDGLMSSDMFIKLSGIEERANKYILPVAGLNTLGGIRTTSEVNSTEGLNPVPLLNGVPYYPEETRAVQDLKKRLGGAALSVDDDKLTITMDDGNVWTVYNTKFTVKYSLTGYECDNTETVVVYGAPFRAALSMLDEHKNGTISCTMGGEAVDVTDGVIDILAVTGNIEIVAFAEVDMSRITNATATLLTHYAVLIRWRGACSADSIGIEISDTDGNKYSSSTLSSKAISVGDGYYEAVYQDSSRTMKSVCAKITGADGVMVTTELSELSSDVRTYNVQTTLTYCTSSNWIHSANDGEPYSTRIIPYDGFVLDSAEYMISGGYDILVPSGEIDIASVTGTVFITASAKWIGAVRDATYTLSSSSDGYDYYTLRWYGTPSSDSPVSYQYSGTSGKKSAVHKGNGYWEASISKPQGASFTEITITSEDGTVSTLSNGDIKAG